MIAHIATANVQEIELQPQPAIARTIHATPAELAGVLAKTLFGLLATVQARGLELAGPPFARYLDRGETLTVEAGIPIKWPATGELGHGVHALALPGGHAIVVHAHGRHDQLDRAHAELDAWLAVHHRHAAGARWEIYLTNPITTPDPAAQDTDVIAPIE